MRGDLPLEFIGRTIPKGTPSHNINLLCIQISFKLITCRRRCLEMSLPTYQEAVDGPEVLEVVAPYLGDQDLVACCQVDHYFKSIFGAYLWKDPFKNLASKANPCWAAHHFFHISKTATAQVRNLVTVIDLRHLNVVREHRTHTRDYLRFGVDLRPTYFLSHNIKCIMMNAAGSEDYRSGPSSTIYFDLGEKPTPEFLGAAGSGIFDISSIAGQHLCTNLIYLDASGTHRGPNWSRFLTSANFPNLRIVKFRSLRLTDDLLPPVITQSEYQIWSLDLRDNLLTDKTIHTLLQMKCFKPSLPRPAGNKFITLEGTQVETTDQDFFQNPPHYEEGAMTGLAPFRPDIIGDVNVLPTSTGNQIPILHRRTGEEDDLLKLTGLTHLYLAGNKFTSKGVKHLLTHTNRLQLLDVGSVRTSVNLPGVGIRSLDIVIQEETTESLTRSACPRLEVLRIHHSIVTMLPSIITRNNNYNEAEILSAVREAQSSHGAETSWKPFQPRDNTKLRELTLTSIPRRASQELFLSLKRFIAALTDQESDIAAARRSIRYHKHAPELLTGLRRLSLEFMSETQLGRPKESVTGDADAEDYYGALAGDFSFMDGREERSGESADKEVLDRKGNGKGNGDEHRSVNADVDVVGELKRWRASELRRWGGKLEIVLM
ncbi:leucine rich repeat domain-containing protein [Rutstroemia sp. NJR-2017a BBW]|nr:leucine rich repeat domain-containing protein [Rutstroemia sp. NJR-2017a BBW]